MENSHKSDNQTLKLSHQHLTVLIKIGLNFQDQNSVQSYNHPIKLLHYFIKK